MLFSVVVPVYNTEKYLGECVGSMLGQSCGDFELLLVDDGSTDGSPALCDGYAAADDRVRVIRKPNGGVTSARIAGAQAARGEYICCVDADDYADKDYLKAFADAINDSGADIVVCGSVTVTGNDASFVRPNVAEGFYDRRAMESKIFPSLIENKDMQSFSTSVWGKAVKTEIFLKVQQAVDRSIKIGEDGACVKPCIFLANSVYVVNKCLYYYRQQISSATHAGSARRWDEPKNVCAVFDKFIDFSQGDLAAQRDRYVVHALFNICVSQFNRAEKNSEIKRDIKQHLRDGFYAQAIRRAKFDALKGKVILFTLKHKSIFLLKKFNKRLKKKNAAIGK